MHQTCRKLRPRDHWSRKFFQNVEAFLKVYRHILCGKFTSAEKKAKPNYYISFPQRRNAHIKSLFLCYLPSLFVFVVFGYYKFCRKSRNFAEIFKSQYGGCGRIEIYCMSGHLPGPKNPLRQN